MIYAERFCTVVGFLVTMAVIRAFMSGNGVTVEIKSQVK